MTLSTGEQVRAIHILPRISRSNDNQKIKFGYLIEYNMRNIFFQKSHIKCGGETSRKPFSKKSKFSINSQKFYAICFYRISQLKLAKIYSN